MSLKIHSAFEIAFKPTVPLLRLLITIPVQLLLGFSTALFRGNEQPTLKLRFLNALSYVFPTFCLLKYYAVLHPCKEQISIR
jgi:hypothetical protein